jgi:hypothetical protein
MSAKSHKSCELGDILTQLGGYYLANSGRAKETILDMPALARAGNSQRVISGCPLQDLLA